LDSLICTAGLVKTYKGQDVAVNGVSFEVKAGSAYGLLGPAGAGKTTVVMMLSGLLRPTKGSCRVCGISSPDEPAKAHRLCGTVTESAKMYGHMTGMQNLVFFGQAFGMGHEQCRERAALLLKRLDLWDARGVKLGAYSTGMAKRLSLARALMHCPKVLLLDEPYSGLDAESESVVDETLSSLMRTEGTAVLICTHQPECAESLCGSFGILNNGTLLADGDTESLRVSAGMKIGAAVRLAENDTAEGFERCSGGWWRTGIADEKEMPAAISKLVAGGHKIFEAKLEKPAVRDIYKQYVGNGGGKK
jgi:ABC-2 type transport system ATP-binding protein